ncbi:hypothetical protein FOZ63_024534 [Perkinsus olseni]|uniref:Uncharacterized protein n=1 Tax=Perkinsus olseni TaxID=32597 RepID=A0A7J6QGZ6_PEROL|nr:hypothetical protein FOZ63_024534 [Perkinsus olseni]
MSEERLASASSDCSSSLACQTPAAWVNGSLTGLGPLLVDHGCQTMTGVTKKGPKIGVGEVRRDAKPRDINAGYYPEERIVPLRAKNYTYPIPGPQQQPAVTPVNDALKNDAAAKSKTAQQKKTGASAVDKAARVKERAASSSKKPTPRKEASAPKVATPRKEASAPKVATPRKEVPPADDSVLGILRAAEASQGDASSAPVSETAAPTNAPPASQPPVVERTSELKPVEASVVPQSTPAAEEDDDSSSSSSGGEDDYVFTIPNFGDDGDSPVADGDDVEMEEQASDVAPTEVVEYPTAQQVAAEAIKAISPKKASPKKASPTKTSVVEPAQSVEAEKMPAVLAVTETSPRKPVEESKGWLLNEDSSDSSDSDEEFLFEAAAKKATAEPVADVKPVEAAKKIVEEEEPPAKKRKKSPKKKAAMETAAQPVTVVPEPKVSAAKKDKLSTPKKARRSSAETKVPDSSAPATDGVRPDKADSVSSEDFGFDIPAFGGEEEKKDEAPAAATLPHKPEFSKAADRPSVQKSDAKTTSAERISDESEEEQGKAGVSSPAPSGKSSRKSTTPMVGTVLSVTVKALKGYTPQSLFEALQKAITDAGGDKSQLIELFWPKKSEFAFLNARAAKSRRSSWVTGRSLTIDGKKCDLKKVEKPQKHSVAQEMKDARGDPNRHAGWTPDVSPEEPKRAPSAKAKLVKRKREASAPAEAAAEKPHVYRDEKVYKEAVDALKSTQGPVTKGSLLHKAIAELLKKKLPEAKECEFELSQGEGEVDPKVTVTKTDGSSVVWTAGQVAETTKKAHKSSRVNTKRRKSRDLMAMKKRINK